MSHLTNRRTMSRLAGVAVIATTSAVLGVGTANAQQSCYPPTPNCSTFTVGRPGATIIITGSNWANADIDILRGGGSGSQSANNDTDQVAFSFAGEVTPDGRLRIQLPADIEPGDYTLAISGTDNQGLARTEERGLEVRDASSSSSSSSADDSAVGSDTTSEGDIVAGAPTSSEGDSNIGALLALLGLGAGGATVIRLRNRKPSTGTGQE